MNIAGSSDYGDNAESCKRIWKKRRKIGFRSLRNSDRNTVKALHEEWFPVKYTDEFYDSLVRNKLAGTDDDLFSVVVVTDANEIKGDNESEIYNVDVENLEGFSKCRVEHDGQCILGCVVGSFVRTSMAPADTVSLLVRDGRRHPLMFYIMTVGTSSDCRKMGLGTALVQKCISEAMNESRCGVVYLHVITCNYAAIKFYEKLGFVRLKEIQGYYTIDDTRHNCYLYAKRFNGNYVSTSVFSLFKNLVYSVWSSITRPLHSRRLTESTSKQLQDNEPNHSYSFL